MLAKNKITMKHFSLPVLLIFISTFLGCSQEQKQPVDYVNPYIGNISHTLRPTQPTTHLPSGMLRVQPNRSDYTGDLLNGLPVFDGLTLSPYQGDEDNLESVIRYSYDQEEVTPYSYSVYLDEQNIKVNYGLSYKSAMYEFSFEKEDDVYIILKSDNGVLTWNGNSIGGYALAINTHFCIHMEPEELPQNVSVLDGNNLVNDTRVEGENACLVLRYPKGTKNIRLRYGVSYIDEDQARKNMEKEVSGKDIETLHSIARENWNTALGKIQVQGGTEDDLAVFYTALYRTYYRPVCISEDGRYYSPFDNKVHEDNGRPFYTDDALWDTYQATHPLRVLINTQMEEDILNSFVLMAGQMDNFWMPTFPGITQDARGMDSNHGVISVLDAYRKGLRRFDLEKTYLACKKAMTEKSLVPWGRGPIAELGKFYWEHGYMPALKYGEKETVPEVRLPWTRRHPVGVSLGTTYDCWALSEIAKELGKTEDHECFLKHSFNYRKIFNPETKFFHPKDNEGNFIEPFDYIFFNGQGVRTYYGENNAWIFRWHVQHNIDDLIDLMGGKEKFVMNLDEMFSAPLGVSKYFYWERGQMPDHTGNVGHYSMGNELTMFIPYLYNYGGQPWKTQKRVRALTKQWFRNDLMGIPGDEDGGGLSSFVVFSMMGFYPVTPGIPVYTIGSPFFENVRIQLGNGKVFKIEARNVSDYNKYIQSATLNGKQLDGPWLRHDDLVNGGKLVLEMGDKPNYEWNSTNY